MQHLNIGLAQYDIIWENSPANLNKLDGMLDSLTDLDVLVLPEMFNTGFSMDAAAIAQEEDGPAVAWLCSRSAEMETTIFASVAICEEGRYYNRCFIVSEGTIVGRYDKRNCFTMAGEEKVYTAGDRNIVVDVAGWRIKPLICYDLRFPLWCYNREEADLMIFMANWPEARISHWDILLQARAIENQAYIAAVNRTGADGGGKSHNGHSAIISPMGEYVTAPQTAEGIYRTTLDPGEIGHYRKMFHLLAEERAKQ